MDPSCLNHILTPAEERQFAARGYIVFDQMLPPEMVAALTAVSARIDAGADLVIAAAGQGRNQQEGQENRPGAQGNNCLDHGKYVLLIERSIARHSVS